MSRAVYSVSAIKVHLNSLTTIILYTVSKDGRIIFSEVRTFMHKEHMTTNLYVSLVTSSNKTIHLTGDHLIYGRESHTEKFNPM